MESYVIILNSFNFSPQNKRKKVDDDDDFDEQMREINKEVNKLKQLYGENYGEVVRCIIFHEKILQYVWSRESICWNWVKWLVLFLDFVQRFRMFLRDQFLLK